MKNEMKTFRFNINYKDYTNKNFAYFTLSEIRLGSRRYIFISKKNVLYYKISYYNKK